MEYCCSVDMIKRNSCRKPVFLISQVQKSKNILNIFKKRFIYIYVDIYNVKTATYALVILELLVTNNELHCYH